MAATRHTSSMRLPREDGCSCRWLTLYDSWANRWIAINARNERITLGPIAQPAPETCRLLKHSQCHAKLPFPHLDVNGTILLFYCKWLARDSVVLSRRSRRLIRNHAAVRFNYRLMVLGYSFALHGQLFAAGHRNREMIQESFGVERGHATRARGRYCLAIS